MNEHKQLILDYIRALSGRPKPPETVARFVADERLASHIAEVEAAFPRYEISIDDLLAEGDKVILRSTFRGIHGGEFAGIAPTQRPVSAGLIIIYAIAGGRIVNHWMQFDLFGLMQQLQETPIAELPTAV